jgi:hypothetical protein
VPEGLPRFKDLISWGVDGVSFLRHASDCVDPLAIGSSDLCGVFARLRY